MNDSIERLESQIRGEDVFIIGGGSSINDLDHTLLYGKKIITINDGYMIARPQDVVAMFWCDSSWADDRFREIEKHPCVLRFTKRQKINVNSVVTGAYGSCVLKHTGDFGYDPNKSSVRGNNGGAQALNLIINMHPKRIFLLGYDMRRINDKSHFHNKHKLAVSDDIYATLFIPSINSMAEELKQFSNIPQIFNCSPFSAIKCFPFFNFNDINNGEVDVTMATSIDKFKQQQSLKQGADIQSSQPMYNAPIITEYAKNIKSLPLSTRTAYKGVDFGLIDTSVQSETVIIVGSGLSLRGFNLNLLKDRGFIITVNDTGKEVLFADAWITIDPWGIHIPQGSKHPLPQLPPLEFSGKIYAGVSENYNTTSCKIVNNVIKIDNRVTFLRRLVRTNNPDATKEHSYQYRLSDDIGCVATGNSGYAAFNLAYLLKPKNILMLGIDGGSGYWFTNAKTNRPLDGLNDLFESSLPQITAAGINVINGSVNSAITCFPRYDITTALSMI